MLLYGRQIAQQMKQDQQQRIEASGSTPYLVAIQAGDNLASTTYIKMKQRYGESIGAKVDHRQCEGDLDSLKALITELNQDSAVNGIIIQLPLPDRSITDTAVALIDPAKDVDGLGPAARFHSATAMAVIKLLEGNNIDVANKAVLIVGEGRLVGRPLAQILKGRAGSLSIADKSTPDLAAKTRQAEVIISATGAGHIITPDMVVAGTVVVDVGTGEDEGGLVGDVDPALLERDDIKVTPSEGGVGPLTVATLFEQLLHAAGI